MPKTIEYTPANRPYHPFGAAVDVWRCRTDCVVSGPFGTGKSRGNLEKLYWCATKYPGMRGIILRKTRKSLTESAMVTWEEKVLPLNHPAKRGAKRNQRSAYYFPNGSVIVVGGLDEPTKVRSTEYDLAVIPEMLEIDESDFDEVSGRMRNNVMPYQQVIGDTNPGPPDHWIKKRVEAGKLAYFESRHEDNPALFNRATGEWTPKGSDYIERLDRLTGVRLQRGRYGKWIGAEGAVYENFDSRIHIINQFKIPADWPRYLAVDFGYTNPFVCQWWALDPDSRLYLYREIYFTGRIVQDHAVRILQASRGDPCSSTGQPLWRGVICDHDAEDRATLERGLKRTVKPAKKEVSPGIQAVSARLRVQNDNKPRLFILRDTVDQVDTELRESGKPTSTVQEFDGYVWDEKNDKKKEVPVKENDHGMDAMRYMVYELDEKLYVRPPVPAESTKTGSQQGSAAKFETKSTPVSDILKKKW